MKFIALLCAALLYSLFAVLYLYVVMLHTNISNNLSENRKLLNQMNEGVLILSKED